MEKTFEELIKKVKYFDSEYEECIVKESDVLKLLKQVGEATKKECYYATEKSYTIEDAMLRINFLPTDRILITENEE